MPKLAEVVGWLDERMQLSGIRDYPGAVNGLQLENRGTVKHVATAVDASAHVARMAAEAGADLLLVHHGMFWGGAQPIRGPVYERLRTLVDHDIAVYSAHLPLDAHAEIGNNVLLARALGLEPSGGFARHDGTTIGVSGTSDLLTSDLLTRASAFAESHGGAAIATPITLDRRTKRWGICTGAGASSATIAEATELGLDTLIVGEGPHHTAVEARDRDIAIIYAGHYATETLGVQALGRELAERFAMQHTFLAAPTGL